MSVRFNFNNFLVASSNLYAVIPIYNSRSKSEFWILMCAMISSIVYHMIEHHKHGMRGIGVFDSKLSHHIFLNIDRFFAILAFLKFFDIRLLSKNYLLTTILLGFMMMGLSEIVFYTPFFKRSYIMTHCAWHVLAFHSIYLAQKY